MVDSLIKLLDEVHLVRKSFKAVNKTVIIHEKEQLLLFPVERGAERLGFCNCYEERFSTVAKVAR